MENKEKIENTQAEEAGYMEDFEIVDEVKDIQVQYITKIEYMPAEQVIEELANDFNLSIHEIEQIVNEQNEQ